jgi:hypothetical protein
MMPPMRPPYTAHTAARDKVRSAASLDAAGWRLCVLFLICSAPKPLWLLLTWLTCADGCVAAIDAASERHGGRHVKRKPEMNHGYRPTQPLRFCAPGSSSQAAHADTRCDGWLPWSTQPTSFCRLRGFSKSPALHSTGSLERHAGEADSTLQSAYTKA